MNGLERLRNFIKVILPALKDHGGSTVPEWLNNIADEIEHDMKENSFYASFERFAKSIGKPIEESPILNLREWLDRWYLPRPVVDGEPVQFGDKLKKDENEFEAFVMSFNSVGYAYVNRVKASDLERVNPDSIEKLREDMNDVVSEVYAITNYEIIDDWLKRAEQLFKESKNNE